MIRSKLSTKAILLATAIGLSAAAFGGSQPAAAQSYTCPEGLAYDPAVGCTLGGDDYGYYGYPAILRGHPDHSFDHGIGGVGHMDGRGVSVAHVVHFGGGGFVHGMGVTHFGDFGHSGFGGFHGGGAFGGGGHR